MENIKNKNIQLLSHNTAETELFKPSEANSPNFNEFNFPQGKDLNILLEYYNKKKGNADFMEKITKFNKKFYNCSENYNKTKKKLEKLNDDLYMNLFKQINCYVEEIERLNKKIASNNNQELKKTIDSLNKEISEKKEKIRNYEIKLKEKTENEEKLMKEIESYKRRIIFYKDKIKIGLLSRSREVGIKSKINVNKKNNQKKNYIFPNSDKKIQILFDKNNINSNEDLSSKIIKKLNSKDDITSTKQNENEEKEKKSIKLRESIYKTDENIDGKRGKILSDLYEVDNDIIEKNEEEFSYNDSTLNLNLDGNSQNFSSKFSNKKSYEISLKDIDEKNKTFDEDNKKRNVYDNQLNKNSGSFNVLDKNFKKADIKSKIINVQKIDKKNNTSYKINVDIKYNSRSRKIDKGMNQKTANKSNYTISRFSEVNTPNIDKKFAKKLILEKPRPISIKSNERKKEEVSKNRFTTNQNQNTNKKLKEIKINEINSINIKTKNKSGKIGNNKDLNMILKVVNDDYINSIEMLKTQEEQIKTMLKLMELDEK